VRNLLSRTSCVTLGEWYVTFAAMPHASTTVFGVVAS
jgi:hypothetical protein